MSSGRSENSWYILSSQSIMNRVETVQFCGVERVTGKGGLLEAGSEGPTVFDFIL